ncbi:MAG: DUF4397 domain-containing protein [Bacteroidota bacterium]|nr:DUF4397 domain-containing protein [Ferruginibacter sp.]
MKRTFLQLFGWTALSLFLASCDKDDDNTTPAQAKVMVVHASPDGPAVDVRVNNSVALSGVTYPSNSPYSGVTAGNTNFKVSPAGTTTYVIDANVTLEPEKNYSVFAIDSVSKIKAAVVTDDLTAPATGKSHVRFLHFSPNAPAVDIAVTGGSVVFPNRSFNDQGTNTAAIGFTPLDAGNYNLEVRLAGTNTVVLAVPNVALAAGKIYTVFAKGFVGGTGAQALGAQVIVNN